MTASCQSSHSYDYSRSYHRPRSHSLRSMNTETNDMFDPILTVRSSMKSRYVHRKNKRRTVSNNADDDAAETKLESKSASFARATRLITTRSLVLFFVGTSIARAQVGEENRVVGVEEYSTRAEHFVEAFDGMTKREKVMIVQKLLDEALRDERERSRGDRDEFVGSKEAPSLRIDDDGYDGNERRNRGKNVSSSSSSSSSNDAEVEMLRQAVGDMKNASQEQKEKAVDILRKLEEEQELLKKRDSTTTTTTTSGFSGNIDKNDNYDDGEDLGGKLASGDDDSSENAFAGDDDIVWDLRTAVASLTTVAKAKMLPPLLFGTAFATLAFALTKTFGEGNDTDNTEIEKIRITNVSDDDAKKPKSNSVTNDNRKNNDDGDAIGAAILPMDEEKRLLFESQKPPRSSARNGQSSIKTKNSNNNSSSTTNPNTGSRGVLWKRKEDYIDNETDTENDDVSEQVKAEEDNIAAVEKKSKVFSSEKRDDQPLTSKNTKSKQRRPPPDASSASFLSEEDREKNFDDIRSRRPR